MSWTASGVDRRTLDLIRPRGHELTIRRVHRLHRPEMRCVLCCAARVSVANLASHVFDQRRAAPHPPVSRRSSETRSSRPAVSFDSTAAGPTSGRFARDLQFRGFAVRLEHACAGEAEALTRPAHRVAVHRHALVERTLFQEVELEGLVERVEERAAGSEHDRVCEQQ